MHPDNPPQPAGTPGPGPAPTQQPMSFALKMAGLRLLAELVAKMEAEQAAKEGEEVKAA